MRAEPFANGSSIEAIWYNGANGDSLIEASDERTLTFFSRYVGDRDEWWIQEQVMDEVVVSHNPRYVAQIRWAGADPIKEIGS